VQEPRTRVLLGVAVLVAAAFIVYLPALHGGILWDDAAHLTRPDLRSPAGLYAIWVSLAATQQAYPLLHTAFWLEWQLWEGNTFAYHVVNVAQHALAACLLWGVLRKLRISGAFLAAAVFLVHPVNVESVAWIAEQKNTLSLLFYLGAAWCYLNFEESPETPRRLLWGTVNARQFGWYFAALGLFVLGLLTKTVIATLPAALLVVCWWRRGRVDGRRDVLPLVPWFALGAAAGIVTAWIERELVGAHGAEFQITFVERALLAGRSVWFYLGKLFWPSPLIFFYPRWTIDSSALTWWLPLLGVVVLLAALVAIAVRYQLRAPLAAVLFFIGTLFPVLGFLNVYPFRFSFVADHFQYQAELGIIALAAGGLMWVAQRRPALRIQVQAVAAAIVVALGWLAWKQSDQYGHDAEYHYRAILQRNPGSWISYENLAARLMDNAQHRDAIPLLQRALDLKPDYFEALRDMAVSYDRLGRLKEALPYYERAARLNPDRKGGENLYGTALLRDHQVEEALRHLRKAIDIAEQENTPVFSFYLDFGRGLLAAGRTDEALAQFRLALKLAGGNYPPADMLIGDTLVRLGRPDEASPHLKRAIDADPADAIHRFDYGRILYNGGRYEEACRYVEEAIKLRPDLVDAYIVLALARSKLGQEAEAREAGAAALRVARALLAPHEIRSIEQVLAPVLGPALTR
jgi:protein O-mannosyl-transferase